MNAKKHTLHILLVEDDDVDAEAVVRAFNKAKLDYPFTIVTNGLEALTLLRNEIIFGDQNGECTSHREGLLKNPYVILLDLNMPRMNGIEFLEELRKDEVLKSSIVFVLTTSNRDEDKLAAYRRQIAGYILKTRADKDFTEVVTLLKQYDSVIEFPPTIAI